MTSSTERPTVFLDIDDVLALNERCGGFDVQRAMAVPADAADDLYRSLFSPAAVQALNKLLREFNPRLVLTTSWLALLERRQFISLFARTGVDISDATLHPHWDAQQDRGVSRLQAIERWMGRHHRGEPILVIDDYSSGESLVGSTWQKSGRVVLCSVDVGFNDDLLDAARRALRKRFPKRATRGLASEVSAAPSANEEFEPSERQRRLVAEAEARVRTEGRKGHFAPQELVRRMQSEGESVTSTPHGPTTSAGGQLFYLTMAAEIDAPLPREEVLRRLDENVTAVAIFRRRPYLLAVEGLISADTHLAAQLRIEHCIKEIFPEANLIDVNGYRPALIAALSGFAEDGVLTLQEFDHELNTLYQEAGEVDDVTRRSAWMDALVFEVLDVPGLVHLRTSHERILCFNRRTPVTKGLARFEEGQRYRCLVNLRFLVVMRAELILDTEPTSQPL